MSVCLSVCETIIFGYTHSLLSRIGCFFLYNLLVAHIIRILFLFFLGNRTVVIQLHLLLLRLLMELRVAQVHLAE